MQRPVVDIRSTTRGTEPRVPFRAMAERILPKRYQLSLCLCGDTLSKRLNRTYRKKSYAPNVLSFPIGRDEGEIFINVRKASREARAFGLPERDRIAHLFVHGCFHLLGLKHGAAMERRERQILKAFGFKQAAESL